MNEKYAFLMIDYETPPLIKELHKNIQEKDLYTEDNGYGVCGKEIETHVTLLACLDNNVNLSDIKKYLRPLDDYMVILTDISSFNNEKYDVLKCSAKSLILEESNEELKKHFKTHSEFKTYNPHVTIAYLKNGCAEKYTKDILSPLIILKPKNFHFSYWEDGKQKDNLFK